MPALRFRGTRAQLRAALAAVPGALAGTAPDPLGLRELFWGTVANLMFEALQDEYEVKLAGGTDLAGVAWEPLSPATIARRLRDGRTDDKILLQSEALVRSLTPGTGAAPSGADGQVREVLPDGVRIGSAVPWADYHQAGVPGRLPARPFLPPEKLPPAWEKVLEGCVEKAMVQVIERVVRG